MYITSVCLMMGTWRVCVCVCVKWHLASVWQVACGYYVYGVAGG